MSTGKKCREAAPAGSKIVIRLWGIMMLLVVFTIAFMWCIQIFILQRNYANATVGEVKSRLEPIMEDLKTEDLAYNDNLIPYLSKLIDGKMLLVDELGELRAMYSYGHPINLEDNRSDILVWKRIEESETYANVLSREGYSREIMEKGHLRAYEIGIPVMYDGRPSYVILYRSFTELSAVLSMSQRQLIVLSFVLTIAAGIFAGVMSRRFIEPIHRIKSTVDSLAKGDLSASPGLELNDELGQLSHSVEELGQALQRVDILRKEVIANVSHELRAPLALIGGYAEMVRDISWQNDERRNSDLNLIIREAKRMSEMVNDIMDYSQLQAGYMKLSKDWYNLYDIVESEVIHCEQSAAEHDIRIKLEAAESEIGELMVMVDAIKISQVMRNLLYNAINHTKDRETITVMLEKRAASYVVSVMNPGESITLEEREIIWERYQRSQHQGGRRQGTGIGLSIVSAILKAHDMAYGVDCKDGEIIFYFSYDFEKQPPPG